MRSIRVFERTNFEIGELLSIAGFADLFHFLQPNLPSLPELTYVTNMHVDGKACLWLSKYETNWNFRQESYFDNLVLDYISFNNVF